MKKLTTSFFLLFAAFWVVAQLPANYYLSAEGKSGKELKTALHLTIKVGTRASYGSGTWTGFEKSDLHPDGYVWDMYSLEKRYFPGGGSAPGGMNIEHSVAKSWWGGSNNDAYKDMYHLNPSDQRANSARGSYPPGINNGSTFNNGSIKVGKNTYGTEYTGASFEPLDEYKGDFARAYMYMFTCYENFSWTGTSAPTMIVANETWPMLKPWAKNMLLEWHRKDPVSTKERNRMAAIYKIQNNRNPYIDYPELVEFIWGSSTTQAWYPGADPGTEPDPEEKEPFTVLPATNIGYNGFTANWTAAEKASAYQIHVFRVEETGTQVPVTLLDVNFASGVPSSWTTEGYSTDTEVKGSLRLASSSNPGILTTDEIDLSGENYTLTVRARQYSNDTGALLTASIDGTVVAEWNTEKDNKYYTVKLPAATETSTLKLSAAKSRRVYVDEIKIAGTTTGAVTIPVNGFPLTLSNVLNYTISGLEPSSTYYYTITPIGSSQGTSSPVPVETLFLSQTDNAAINPISTTLSAEGIQVQLDGGKYQVQLIDLTGKMVYSSSLATGTLRVPISSKGIFLLRVFNETFNATQKLIF